VTDLLSILAPDERAEVLRVAHRRRFKRGEVVFHEGDPGDACHVVTKGLFIARSASTLGHVIAVNVFPPGSVFGEMVLLNHGARRSATVEAWGASETLMLPRASVESLRARSPVIDRFLLQVLSERNRVLTAQLVELLFAPVEQRIFRRLLAFADVDPAQGPDGIVHIDQSQLAILAGTTRATVSRTLAQARDAGLVQTGRGTIRILDRDGLERRFG